MYFNTSIMIIIDNHVHMVPVWIKLSHNINIQATNNIPLTIGNV